MLPRHYLTAAQIRPRLGMVIPIWFPPDVQDAALVGLIRLTLADADLLVHPCHQVLVCDGQPHVQQSLRRHLPHADELVIRCTEQNLGKGGAVAEGLRYLLEHSDVAWIVVRDADGDHAINDVPHLARLAAQMEAELEHTRLLVVGGRVDVHRPMGFVRGAYEQLVNDVIWHALQFAQARRGMVLNTQYFAEHGFIPDFHSGFKLYTRESAGLAQGGLYRASEDFPELDMLRHGAEPVPFVEILAADGVVGQVNRVTLETQPVVTSTGMQRVPRYANRVIWAFRRLEIPLDAAWQMLDNALTRCMLYKSGDHLDEVLQWRARILTLLGGTGQEPLHVHAFG